MVEKTIFEKILDKEIPCNIVYEDDHTIAFHDINPQAPVHLLIIPKKKIINALHLTEEDVEFAGRVLLASRKIAEKLNLEQSGYRLVFNNGAHAGQTVFYMHCHFLAGRDFRWPPG